MAGFTAVRRGDANDSLVALKVDVAGPLKAASGVGGQPVIADDLRALAGPPSSGLAKSYK